MKLGILINSKPSIERLLQQPLDINISWKIKTFVNKANPEFKAYDEIRTQRIIELGEIVTDESSSVKGQHKVKKENEVTFYDEMAQLQEKEVDVIVPHITMKMIIGHSEKTKIPISITTADLLVLDWLIKEE